MSALGHKRTNGCAERFEKCRVAVRTYCFAFTGLRDSRAESERGHQSSKNDTLHCSSFYFCLRIHIPAAFLRLLHSLQYFGQVIPAGTFPAALSAFQSAPQARSRAYSACLPSAGFLAVVGAIFGAGAAGGAVVVVAGLLASALHFATYAFSVMLAASFSTLLARHSSWQALTVFFCANEGVAENARHPKISAKHPRNAGRFFMSTLRVLLIEYEIPAAPVQAIALFRSNKICLK